MLNIKYYLLFGFLSCNLKDQKHMLYMFIYFQKPTAVDKIYFIKNYQVIKYQRNCICLYLNTKWSLCLNENEFA